LGVSPASIKHPKVGDLAAFSVTPSTLSAFVKGEAALECKKVDKCLKEEDNHAAWNNACGSGKVLVGTVKNGCGVCPTPISFTRPAVLTKMCRRANLSQSAVHKKAPQRIASGGEAHVCHNCPGQYLTMILTI
jgi:hypothetical protein